MTEEQLEKLLDERMASICPPSSEVAEKIQARWDTLAKPLGSLGRLEQLWCRIGAIQQKEHPSIRRKWVVVFCADNGVVEEGVTQTSQHITKLVAENMVKGRSSVCTMAKVAGAQVLPVDIGMACPTPPGVLEQKIMWGTHNLRKEPAMSRSQVIQAVLLGMELAQQCWQQGAQLLATGEMGIGNTTTSSAVAAVLLDRPVEELTGRGAGLSSQGLQKKIQVIKDAIELHKPNKQDPLDVLSKVGGLDLAGMVGLFLGGALYGMPVLMDGFISSVAALAACRLCPALEGHLLPSHRSKEPGAQLVLDALGLHPMLHGELSLGEGTGAVAVMPLLDMAAAMYDGLDTFQQLDMKAYEHLD